MNVISVIIPIYKVKIDYLRKCLDSIISQDLSFFYVYLIDDGSPDNCGTICDEYVKKSDKFKVIHQKNQGVSVARNVGIKESNSEWITFIDPDDWIENDWAEVLLNAVETANADIIMFDYYQEFASKQTSQFFMPASGYLNEEYLKAIKIAPFNQFIINGKHKEYETNVIWNKIYRANLIKNNNIWFDSEARKGQDVIFNAEILQITSRIYYIHKPLYHYRYLQESITNRYNPNVRFYNEIAFKHYERIIEKYSLPNCYKEAFYARVLTRLYSCMRLFYFHKQNAMSFASIKSELNQILDSYPYNIALKAIDYSCLTYSEKLFVYALKKRNYKLLQCLVKGRVWLRETLKQRFS